MSLSPRQRLAVLSAATGSVLLASVYAGTAREVVPAAPSADGQAPAIAAPAASPKADAEVIAPQSPRADADLEQAQRRLNPPERSEQIQDAFAPRTWAPPPPAPAPVMRAPPPVAAAPVPPPLPYQYMGQLSEQGRTLVFLNRGEVPLVGRVGETLEGNYRIERIAETAVEFTYLPLNARQVLPIGGLQ